MAQSSKDTAGTFSKHPPVRFLGVVTGLALLLCLGGCKAPSNGNTPYIDAVKAFRPERNGFTVGTLLDLQTYPGAATATVTSRDWQAEPDGSNWMVTFVATSSSDVKVWKWEVDSRGSVTPANELATGLAAYDTTIQARISANPEAVATASASPSSTPVAMATDTPPPVPVTPAPTVTVTVTPTPAEPASSVAPPSHHPTPPPPPPPPARPPSVVEYKGVMQTDSRMVATLVIDGVYYQASTGDTVADGYRVVRVTPTEVDLRYHGEDVRAIMAPHSGGVQFTPAPPDGPPPIRQIIPQGGPAVPGETPIELTPHP